MELEAEPEPSSGNRSLNYVPEKVMRNDPDPPRKGGLALVDQNYYKKNLPKQNNFFIKEHI